MFVGGLAAVESSDGWGFGRLGILVSRLRHFLLN